MIKRVGKKLLLFTLVAMLVVQVLLPPIAFAEDDIIEAGYDPDFYSANDILYYDPRAVSCGVNVDDLGSGGDMNTTEVEKTFTLGSDNSMRAVNLANQMKKDFALTDAQAAGIVGNFMWESGGAHLPPNMNEGGKTGPPAFHGGYGWAQWTGGRQTQFINFAISKGYINSNQDQATDAANYAFLKYELIKTERSTLPAVGKTTTAADAARAFEANFERAGKPVLDKRIAHANTLYAALKSGKGIDINAPPTDSGDGAAGGEATNCVLNGGIPAGGRVFDTVVFPLAVKESGVKNKGIFKNGTTQRGGHPYIAFDILADAGTTVLALTSGTVTLTRQTGSMGGMIVIYNPEKKLHVFYTHMRPKASIEVGDEITPGTPIGSLVSVKQYPSINADHLHIDAGTGKVRLGCSRSNPNGAGCKTRVDIGPDLYNAWQQIVNPTAATPPPTGTGCGSTGKMCAE